MIVIALVSLNKFRRKGFFETRIGVIVKIFVQLGIGSLGNQLLQVGKFGIEHKIRRLACSHHQLDLLLVVIDGIPLDIQFGVQRALGAGFKSGQNCSHILGGISEQHPFQCYRRGCGSGGACGCAWAAGGVLGAVSTSGGRTQQGNGQYCGGYTFYVHGVPPFSI
ncbi:hypothetical protein D3C75_1046170 [compost metagenome]